MHQLRDQHRAEIALLCHRYGVRRLEIFGSAARATVLLADEANICEVILFPPNQQGEDLMMVHPRLWPRPG